LAPHKRGAGFKLIYIFLAVVLPRVINHASPRNKKLIMLERFPLNSGEKVVVSSHYLEIFLFYEIVPKCALK
jgi:hypothetical protein